MKHVIRSQYNIDVKKSKNRFEKIEGKSQTIQGETRTIAELLRKEVTGMPIGRRPVEYMEVEDIDKISEFYRPIVDLTDLQRLKEHNAALEYQINEFEKYKKEQDAIDPSQLEMFDESPKVDSDKISPDGKDKASTKKEQ